MAIKGSNLAGMHNSALDEELDVLSYAVIGAAIEVHRLLGPGFPESVYEEALCFELELRGIHCARQVPIHITYKSRDVGEGRIDILVDNSLVVELKAVEAFSPMHVAQVLSYLKATKNRVGLLLNFNVLRLKEGGIKRYIYDP